MSEPLSIPSGPRVHAPSTRRVTPMQRVLLVASALVFCALALAAGEVACRVLFDISYEGNSRELFVGNRFGDSMGNAPNAHGISFGAEVWTDGSGFRVPKGHAAEPGKPALLVIGDSVGFGVGVDEPRTFVGLMRQALPGTEVYNSSVIGYALADYRNVVERFLPAHPEVTRVLVAYCLNDVSRQSAAEIRAFLEESSDQDLLGRIKAIPMVKSLNAYLRARSKLYLGTKNLLTDPSLRTFRNDREYYAVSDDELAPKLQPLLDLIATLRERHIEVLVAVAPAEPQLRSSDAALELPQQRLRQWLSAHEVPYVDALPAFRAYQGHRSRLFLSGDAMHFSVSGHQLFFDTVHRQLTRHAD